MVDLLVLISLEDLLFILKILLSFFYQTSSLNWEVNCAEPSISINIPSRELLAAEIGITKRILYCKHFGAKDPQNRPKQ
jgi:hypothetical protein